MKNIQDSGQGNEKHISNIAENEVPVQTKDGLNFPIGTIESIMRRALPHDTRISKEAKEAMNECAAEFIRWVTYNTNTYCDKQKTSTVSAEDIIVGLKGLGFDNYDKVLTTFLERYREDKKKQKEIGGSSSSSHNPQEGSSN